MKTIYKNGAVYTGVLPLVQAFAVENGKFEFIYSVYIHRQYDIRLLFRYVFLSGGF